LARLGYWARRTEVLPLGIDYILDVCRIPTQYDDPIQTIVDVGAHTGESIGAFDRRWPEARILAIEADPDTYVALAGSPVSRHAECLKLALSDNRGQAEFYRFGHQATCSSLLRDGRLAVHSGLAPVGTVTVRCDTLDNLVRERKLERFDSIKIDTEGSELRVLDGVAETLSKRTVKSVYLEFNRIPAMDGKRDCAFAPLPESLDELDFSFVATCPEHPLLKNGYFSTRNALLFRNTSD
jgi:FkbM family methyltransferase